MYSRSSATTTGGAARTILPVIGSIICIGLILLLLAATIVLALIPLYISEKSATLSSGATTNDIYLYINTGGSDSGRRRRASDTNSTSVVDGSRVSDYVGGSFDSTGNAAVKEKCKKVMTQNQCFADITEPSCKITSISVRRRRFLFAKREVVTVILCVFRGIFNNKICSSSSKKQSAATAAVDLLVNGITPGSFSFSNLNILRADGSVWVQISVLRFTGLRSRPVIAITGGVVVPTFATVAATTAPGNSTNGNATTTISNITTAVTSMPSG